jgi:uncharacterized membrane protein
MKKLFNGFPEIDRIILLSMIEKGYQKSKEIAKTTNLPCSKVSIHLRSLEKYEMVVSKAVSPKRLVWKLAQRN